MVFETAFGITIKEILEIGVAAISLVLFYVSYKTFTDLRIYKSKYVDSFKLISFGFIFFFFSMLFELIDSFYFSYAFDKLQLVSGTIAFILFLIGFRDSFNVSKKKISKRRKANA